MRWLAVSWRRDTEDLQNTFSACLIIFVGLFPVSIGVFPVLLQASCIFPFFLSFDAMLIPEAENSRPFIFGFSPENKSLVFEKAI